jgi:hypothetical protein
VITYYLSPIHTISPFLLQKTDRYLSSYSLVDILLLRCSSFWGAMASMFGLGGKSLLEEGSEYKMNGDDSDEEDKVRKTGKVLQLSSLKVYAPAEGFSILREIYLTRSGATDSDLEKISRICQAITTLDCSGCPRIGDNGMNYLVPKMVKTQGSKGGYDTALCGLTALKKLYLHGTSVTNAGVRGILASKVSKK